MADRRENKPRRLRGLGCWKNRSSQESDRRSRAVAGTPHHQPHASLSLLPLSTPTEEAIVIRRRGCVCSCEEAMGEDKDGGFSFFIVPVLHSRTYGPNIHG
ncbi:hypothetical protein PAHAL_1G431600 [Panicum hallii]|jgi:hypothetical protein|uniref:Uncharacterized protein n=1 Tax=Panicum hallii TaxID=206008 RepID=A0A2T8KY63_9POAL|nr:hypothetical protein PAHAL_1G431600 [Panicum hallii]